MKNFVEIPLIKDPFCRFCFRDNKTNETMVVAKIELEQGVQIIRQCLKCKLIQ